MGQEGELFCNGAGEVGDGFADVGGVVVGFVGVLGARGGLAEALHVTRVEDARGRKELLVCSLESIDTLFELNVVGWELGL